MSIINAKCKNCGGSLIFNPKSQNVSCTKCNHEYYVEKIRNRSTHPVSEVKDLLANSKSKTIIYTCENCGAKLEVVSDQYSGVCPYCKSTYIASLKGLQGFKPDAIIPFAFDKGEALNRLKIYFEDQSFTKKNLINKINNLKIDGNYIPCFSFSFKTSSSYKGFLYRTVQTDEGTEKEYFRVNDIINQNYKKIYVETSNKLDNNQLYSILPYVTDYEVKYNEAFAYGLPIEQCSDSFNDSLQIAKNKVEQMIKDDIIAKHNADGMASASINTSFIEESYSYVVLPIYNISFRYGKKEYKLLMNGQTGKTNGKIPKSKGKIFALTLFITLLSTGFISFILYATGIFK